MEVTSILYALMFLLSLYLIPIIVLFELILHFWRKRRSRRKSDNR